MRHILISSILLCAAFGPAQASETNSGPAEIIACPAKEQSTRSFDLSTGGAAPWVVNGPGIPNGAARATPIDDAQLPKSWRASIDGARWVQALPSNDVQKHAPGDFVFTLTFQVKKGKRMPRLSLTGQVITDEMFELNVIEPSPVNQHISSGLAMGDDSPGEVEQSDVQEVNLSESGLLNGKPLGHRAGIYTVQIVAPNNEGQASEVGVLAGLTLTAKCGGK